MPKPHLHLHNEKISLNIVGLPLWLHVKIEFSEFSTSLASILQSTL